VAGTERRPHHNPGLTKVAGAAWAAAGGGYDPGTMAALAPTSTRVRWGPGRGGARSAARGAGGGDRTGLADGVVLWVAVALVATVAWLRVVTAVRRSDLLVFLEAGRDVAGGVDPYPVLGTPEVYGGSAFVYPYVTALPFVPLGLLPTRTADLVFYLVSVAAVVAACRLAGVRGALATVAVLAAACTLRGLQLGTLNALLLLGVVACWRLRDRALPLAVVAAAVVVAKLFLAPLVVWMVLSRRWAAAGWTALFGGVLLAGGWALGPRGPADYLEMLRVLQQHERADGWSLTRWLGVAGASPQVATVLAAGVATVLVLGAWLAVRRGYDPVLLFAATVVGTLLASPIVWSHYLVLLLVPLLLVRAPAAVLALAAVTSWLLAPPDGTGVVRATIDSYGTYEHKLAAVQLLALAAVGYAGWRARPGRTSVSPEPGSASDAPEPARVGVRAASGD